MILNRAAVERYWNGENPVSEQIIDDARQFGPLGRVLTETLEAEIVGIVGNVKNTSLEDAAEPAIYFSQSQLAYRSMNVLVRGQGEPEDLKDAVKSVVWDLDDTLPVARIKTLQDLGARSRDVVSATFRPGGRPGPIRSRYCGRNELR